MTARNDGAKVDEVTQQSPRPGSRYEASVEFGRRVRATERLWMAGAAAPLGSSLLLVMGSAASLEEIRGTGTHHQSASSPYDHRRFMNFAAPEASEPYLTKS